MLLFGKYLSDKLQEGFKIIFFLVICNLLPVTSLAPSSSLVRTDGSQPSNTGSNPVGATKLKRESGCSPFLYLETPALWAWHERKRGGDRPVPTGTGRKCRANRPGFKSGWGYFSIGIEFILG